MTSPQFTIVKVDFGTDDYQKCVEVRLKGKHYLCFDPFPTEFKMFVRTRSSLCMRPAVFVEEQGYDAAVEEDE